MTEISPSHYDATSFWSALLKALHTLRNVNITVKPPHALNGVDIAEILRSFSLTLESQACQPEAEAIERAREKVVDSPNFGGLGLGSRVQLSNHELQEVLFLVEAWLEALNSQEKASRRLPATVTRQSATRPMTLSQKIFAQHVVGGCPAECLRAGDVVSVSVDWIIASELSWSAMAQAHEELGSPGIWRNDRFWLAGDHVVHPKVASIPKVKAMVDTANKAKKDFRMTEFQGMNYTIMHTEFVRERAEPGMLVIGSDSHSCSAGATGCLAIGLGSTDVMMALSVGETWFKIPDSILIEVVGEPSFGITGKDVILYILKKLKRNTVAAERIVEFAGEGLKHLSCDARFAIANMCTEFGAITGIFQPDDIIQEYISRRRRKANKVNSAYFRADADAEYAGKFVIDLGKIEPFIAVYPEPDNVVPVSEKADVALDGVFIGACTTTEEELVLAALVLKAGLKKGLPLARGKRHYVPGSLPIVEKLRELQLLEVYEAAGFTRGPPGCSFCLGLSADKAAEGEVWLSSQNRNFKNRMGPGALGHVTTAMVCAASSFSLKITDPASLIADMDIDFFKRYRGELAKTSGAVTFVEPGLLTTTTAIPEQPQEEYPTNPSLKRNSIPTVKSKVVRLGDFIDTDALSPGFTLTSCVTDEEFGQHVLELTHPEFRQKVKDGQRVVVAGHAFGVGSSRETAVQALKGAGVQAVIARSFAFIYSRNQPSLGLLGFTITDPTFYELATENAEITIDATAQKVQVAGREFGFCLSDIEYNLTANRGIAKSFRDYGRRIWTAMNQSRDHNQGQTKHSLRDGTNDSDSRDGDNDGDYGYGVGATTASDHRLEW